MKVERLVALACTALLLFLGLVFVNTIILASSNDIPGIEANFDNCFYTSKDSWSLIEGGEATCNEYMRQAMIGFYWKIQGNSCVAYINLYSTLPGDYHIVSSVDDFTINISEPDANTFLLKNYPPSFCKAPLIFFEVNGLKAIARKFKLFTESLYRVYVDQANSSWSIKSSLDTKVLLQEKGTFEFFLLGTTPYGTDFELINSQRLQVVGNGVWAPGKDGKLNTNYPLQGTMLPGLIPIGLIVSGEYAILVRSDTK